MKYDVFISYRRLGGKEKARPLKSELEKRGYKVFLDFDDLKDSVFDKRIMDAIDEAPIFLIILSEHSLDRCKDEDDWVRKEIEYANMKNKHFVPVNPDKEFKDFPNDIPDSVKECLGQHQFSSIDFEQLFQVSVDMMIEDRIKPIIANLREEKKNQKGALVRIETDLDCRVMRFKEELAIVKTDDVTEIRLPKGTHKLTFEGLESKEDSYSTKQEITDLDYEYYIEVELLEKHNARKKEEAKVKAEQERIDKEKREAEVKRLEKEKQAQLEKERREREAKAKAEQERIEKEKREAEEKIKIERERLLSFDVNGVSFNMIKVEGGTFKMGATSEQGSDAYSNEKPVHSVTLSGYYIGETEVTQELWEAVMGNNPSDFSGSQKPVEYVSWNDCQNFIAKLNRLTGKKFKLPTEAEWEYAARGGNKSKGYKYSGSDRIRKVAWYGGNFGIKTHNVKTKSPNELGIYDMSGNVWEWCQDWYGDYSGGSQTNPKGPSSGSSRVLRGGSWDDYARRCRVSVRDFSYPGNRYDSSGFRLVL